MSKLLLVTVLFLSIQFNGIVADTIVATDSNGVGLYAKDKLLLLAKKLDESQDGTNNSENKTTRFHILSRLAIPKNGAENKDDVSNFMEYHINGSLHRPDKALNISFLQREVFNGTMMDIDDILQNVTTDDKNPEEGEQVDGDMILPYPLLRQAEPLPDIKISGIPNEIHTEVLDQKINDMAEKLELNNTEAIDQKIDDLTEKLEQNLSIDVDSKEFDINGDNLLVVTNPLVAQSGNTENIKIPTGLSPRKADHTANSFNQPTKPILAYRRAHNNHDAADVNSEKEFQMLKPTEVLSPPHGNNPIEDNEIEDDNRKSTASLNSQNVLPDINPEEGEYEEGDLILPSKTASTYRSALLNKSSYWPGGLVPYELNGTFSRTELRQLLIAFDQYAIHTCIKFYPRTTEKSYLSIEKSKSGCSSSVGFMGRKQNLNLAPPDCFRYGIIMHELMHTLGFLHEQNRYDRDDYVKIIYENIKQGHEKNFDKFTKEGSTNQGIPYDYGSIMHYRLNSFSRNGQSTMVALQKVPKNVIIGQRNAFSASDIENINQRYRCNNIKGQRNNAEANKEESSN